MFIRGSASTDYRRVMEMQEPQGYAQTQFSEERKQRVSQAKKRYNCYTENIAQVTRQKLWKHDSDVPEVIRKSTQQEAQAKAAKHCSTENRQQEAQLWQLSTNLSRSGLPGVQFPLGIVASCVFMFKYLMYTLVRACST